MNRKTSYETCITAVKQIEIKKDSHPRIPPHEFLQEAYDLYVWCKEDIEQLTAVGINKTVIEELPIRIEAAQEAHTIWEHKKRSKSETKDNFETQLKEAKKLKSELVHTFRFAFRKTPELLEILKRSLGGIKYSELIQCLNDLAALGQSNLPLLQEINFNDELLSQASDLSDELAQLLASSHSERYALTETKLLRDKAFIYLKQSIDLIREAGRYAFAKDTDHRKGYSSNYWKRTNQKRRKPTIKNTTNGQK